ncbi:MAG: DUF2007 domain-containing protein [Mucilaginibacter sp.]|nr:DUF2007 domain-containing protein [Mucilaginibacter sp.]
MKTGEDDKLVQIFAGTAVDAGFVKSLLESEGVEAYGQNELMGTIAPWQVSGGNFNAVQILVAAKDAEKAAEILTGYQAG